MREVTHRCGGVVYLYEGAGPDCGPRRGRRLPRSRSSPSGAWTLSASLPSAISCRSNTSFSGDIAEHSRIRRLCLPRVRRQRSSLPVRLRCPLPSAFMTWASRGPSRLLTNAIFRPSGDHDGRLSHAAFRVRFRFPLPSAFARAGRRGAAAQNDTRLSEPYLRPAYRGGETGSWERNPSDGYFVLGDNRAMSCDSRRWGVVPRASIIGRAK